MSLSQVLQSEPGLTLLGTVLGGFWTLFKSSEWWARRRRRRFSKGLNVLEAAVEETFRTYVRAIKASRADGKLTEAEKRRARELASQCAARIARRQGLDVARELGDDFLDLWIAKLVKKLKHS